MLKCPACGETTPVSSEWLGLAVACSHCDATVRVSEVNTRRLTMAERDARPEPVPDRKPQAEEQAHSEVHLFLDDSGPATPVTASRPAPTAPVQKPAVRRAQEQCSRCGRPIRGDWDRFETPDGVRCNICAHHIDDVSAGVAPPSVPAPTPLLREIANQNSWAPAMRELAAPPSPEERQRRRRGMIILAAVAVVMMGLALLWPSDEGPSKTPAPVVQEVKAPPRHPQANLVISILFGIAQYTTALYVTLHIIKGLPNETLFANLAAVSMAGTLFYVISAALGYLAAMVAMAPMAGPILALLLGLVTYVILAFVAQGLYDLRFGEIITFFLINILASLLFRALGGLVLGVISALTG